MSGVLLLPLHGALFVIGLVVLAIKIWALVDAATHPDVTYRAAGKWSKTPWLLVLAVGLLLNWIGLIAAIVYLVDVRPALRALRRGGGSSNGPYGPW